MRLIIQRSPQGSVVVDGETVGKEENGVVCLVGIHRDDKEEDLDWTVQKLLSFCLFDGDDGTPYKKSIVDVGGDILLVSQFTLYARLGSGRRPDFSRSMGNEAAGKVFEQFVDKVKAAYESSRVQTGSFGAMMEVHILNDGPTTFTFDSANK